MWDPADVAWLQRQLSEKLSSSLGCSWEALFEQHGGQVRARWRALFVAPVQTALQLPLLSWLLRQHRIQK